MRSLCYRWVGLLMLTLHVGGCYTWRSVPRTAGLQIIEQEQAREVRLQRTDGTEVEVLAPLARNDTIIWANGTESLAYADVRLLEVQRFSFEKTAGLAAGLFAAVIGAGYYFVCVVGDCFSN